MFYNVVVAPVPKSKMSTESSKHVCTMNHTVEIESDTVVFFESPDFPKVMTDDEIEQCYINFTLTLSTEEQDKNFYQVITNSFCPKDVYGLSCTNFYNFVTNFTTYVFDLNDVDNYGYPLNYRGFAYFDDWGNDCPLESISRINPFEFTDISQILLIRSTNHLNIRRTQSCLWQFKAPKNYGFKIVITDLNIFNTTVFKVENKHDVIITETEFIAYVTIVKNFFNDGLIDCVYETLGNITKWSFWNEKGYPNNARCIFILTILPKTEVIATIRQIKVEDSVDVINYYPYNNSLPNNIFRINDSITFAAEDENKKREVLWEFITDGSIQSRGFEIEFETKYCTCANSVINVPCTGSIDKYLMKNSDKYGFFCGNLKCNFTIKLDPTCTSQFIVLMLFSDNFGYAYDSETFDIFRIFSNGVKIYQTNFLNMVSYLTRHYLRIPSSNQNILEAITDVSEKKRGLRMIFWALNISTTLPTVIVNETKPYYFHDYILYETKVPYMISIELSPNLKNRNYNIDFFVFDMNVLNDFTFHKDTNISNRLNFQDCFIKVANSVFKCKTNLQSLTIIKFGSYYNNLFFQISKGNSNPLGSEGCIFKNNVFTYFNYNGKTTAISNERKACRIFISTTTYLYFQDLRISSPLNGTFTIFGGVEEREMVTFDPSSLSLWKDLYFDESIYILEIPIKSSLMLTGYYDTSYQYQSNITNVPYKSIITSPNLIIQYFDGCGNDYNHDYSWNVFIQDATVKFTVLDMDVSESNYFYFLSNSSKIKITSALHSLQFESSHIEFRCSCSSREHCRIRVLLETIIDNEKVTINTPPTSTTLITLSNTVTTETSFSGFLTVNYLLIFGLCITFYVFKNANNI